jgi:HlyD family type I secretion membrane fusion protein
MSEKEEGSKDFKLIIRRTFLVILVFLGGFLVWAALAPLSTGAVAPGTVTVATYRKILQHQHGGAIKEILVREGDFAKKGQVLIRLDDANAKAQLAQVRSEYFQSMVAKYRLIAERTLSGKISYPPEIIEMSKDREFARFMTSQQSLFLASKEKYESERRGTIDVISSLKETKDQLVEQKKSLERQMEIQKKQLDSLKESSEQGYYPRNRYLDLQRGFEEIHGKKIETEAGLMRTESSIREYGLRLRSLETEYLRQIETELNEIDKKATTLKDQYVAALNILEKTEIRAPENGVVMNLDIHTIGGVITPGQPLLEILPEDATLIVEAKVNPNDIEGIHIGAKADLRFTALNAKKTPVFEGTLLYLSPDVQFDENMRMSYYLARTGIDESSMKKLHSFQHEIKPGMPVQVILKKGERTFLSYLLKVFVDRLSVAFTR